MCQCRFSLLLLFRAGAISRELTDATDAAFDALVQPDAGSRGRTQRCSCCRHHSHPLSSRFAIALLARDILVGTSADPNMLRLLPPLILSTDHVQRLAKALEDLTDAPL
jgi:acetylornithine/succinyldiaminopimelate/putrescine aminotransferase